MTKTSVFGVLALLTATAMHPAWSGPLSISDRVVVTHNGEVIFDQSITEEDELGGKVLISTGTTPLTFRQHLHGPFTFGTTLGLTEAGGGLSDVMNFSATGVCDETIPNSPPNPPLCVDGSDQGGINATVTITFDFVSDTEEHLTGIFPPGGTTIAEKNELMDVTSLLSSPEPLLRTLGVKVEVFSDADAPLPGTLALVLLALFPLAWTTVGRRGVRFGLSRN